MMAYANPENRKDETKRADGFGIARFNKKTRTITFESWPRFADARAGDSAQFPGWPITVNASDNDGRKPLGYLPELLLVEANEQPVNSFVVQVIEEDTNEILYTFRTASSRVRLPVYRNVDHTIKVGRSEPDLTARRGFRIPANGETPLHLFRFKNEHP